MQSPLLFSMHILLWLLIDREVSPSYSLHLSICVESPLHSFKPLSYPVYRRGGNKAETLTLFSPIGISRVFSHRSICVHPSVPFIPNLLDSLLIASSSLMAWVAPLSSNLSRQFNLTLIRTSCSVSTVWLGRAEQSKAQLTYEVEILVLLYTIYLQETIRYGRKAEIIGEEANRRV